MRRPLGRKVPASWVGTHVEYGWVVPLDLGREWMHVLEWKTREEETAGLALLASMVCCGCCYSQTMCGSLAYVRLGAGVDGRRQQGGSVMKRREELRRKRGEGECQAWKKP